MRSDGSGREIIVPVAGGDPAGERHFGLARQSEAKATNETQPARRDVPLNQCVVNMRRIPHWSSR